MNVLVATDGSKYGRWELNWVATLPFIEPPRVTALHVLDSAVHRLPFRTKLETQRMEARLARTITNTKKQLVLLKLKGTVRKEQGAVASVILKRTPKRDGLLVVGSQGLDILDRFMLGSVSTKLIHHATCPVLVVKGEAAPLRRIVLATDGSSASAKALEFVLTTFQSGSFERQGRACADSRERGPCDAVHQIPGAEGGRAQAGRPKRAEAGQGGIYGRASVSAWEAC